MGREAGERRFERIACDRRSLDQGERDRTFSNAQAVIRSVANRFELAACVIDRCLDGADVGRRFLAFAGDRLYQAFNLAPCNCQPLGQRRQLISQRLKASES